MTTATFLRQSGAVATTMAAIHGRHADTFPPGQTIRQSMQCPRCRGTLPYTVSATGEITFRCSSSGCIRTI